MNISASEIGSKATFESIQKPPKGGQLSQIELPPIFMYLYSLKSGLSSHFWLDEGVFIEPKMAQRFLKVGDCQIGVKIEFC